jgi:polyisoprenoid-binding protein YceI
MPTFYPRRRWVRWIIVAAAVVIVAGVAGPYAYIHLLSKKAPAQLSLTPSATPSSASAAPSSAASATPAAQAAGSSTLDGTWTVGSGSEVQYRVKEVLLGQSQTAVGVSHSVTGRLVIGHAAATVATFSVPMQTIKSDKSQRDAQFDGRIMDVASYPTGTFTLTRPISLAPLPASGTARTYTAIGLLNLHGQSHSVSFTLQAERAGTAIKVAGQINVPFAGWGISNPSFGGFVTTEDHGVLEFLLVFGHS